jgi:hypothetical protein
MKKIILGIITILLAAAIFGCGRVQQSSGGGSSGGNGGSGDSPATFTISGAAKVPESIADNYASLPVRFGRGLASLLLTPAHAAEFGFSPLKNADVKIFEFGKDAVVTTAKTDNDGHYTVSLPQGKIYVVVIEKAATDGTSAPITIKNIAHEKELEVDVTPVTSVAVEAISRNVAVRETLLAVNSGTGGSKPNTVTGVIEATKKTVENYYDKHRDELSQINVTSPPTPPLIPSIKEIRMLETYLEGETHIVVSPNPVHTTRTPVDLNGSWSGDVVRYFYSDDQQVTISVQGAASNDINVLEYVPSPSEADGGLNFNSDEAVSLVFSGGKSVTLNMNKNYAFSSFEHNSVAGIVVGEKGMDGNMSDWNTTCTVLFDDASKESWEENPKEGYGSNYKIKSVKAAKDAEYLYILWEGSGEFASNCAYKVYVKPAVLNIEGLPGFSDDINNNHGVVSIGIDDSGTLSGYGGRNQSSQQKLTDSVTGEISADKKSFEIKIKTAKIKELVESSAREEFEKAYSVEFSVSPHRSSNWVVKLRSRLISL